jgi:4-alpha-glucanotransferase
LFELISDVIFLEEPGSHGDAFHPRHSLHRTRSYRDLDDRTQARLDDIYTHYFYHRHEDFWREHAMQKLPAIKHATNMLICGEDLGMVPDCVEGAMHEAGILSLFIQRMPKDPKREFHHPADSPYLAVSATGSHDMSTLRGWWEENRERTQRFYRDIMGHDGFAPFYCEPWICREIVVQHLYSPSMWAVFPLQDLLAMDGGLRRENPTEERINVPSNPRHYWKYRMHLELEDLPKAEDFNNMLRSLVQRAGR